MLLLKKYTRAVCLMLAVWMALTLWIAAPPTTVKADDDVSWLLTQINGLRASHGLRPLALNPQLMASATAHSNYLATNPWVDPHIEANGSTPHSRMAAAGYPGASTGENVYGGGLATAAIAFTWWLGSPVHYRSMVYDGFSEVGIGIGSGPYGHFFTTDFGDRGGASSAPPSPVPNAANPPGALNIAANVLNVLAPPRPTRRPATALPTSTPAPTLTPSETFTPLPTHTDTPTATLEPPTSTAIVIALSPQVSQGVQSSQVTVVPSAQPSDVPTDRVAVLPVTAVIPSGTPVAVALLSTAVTMIPPSGTPTALVTMASPTVTQPPPPTPENPVRTLLPFAIGLPVVMLGGFVLWNRRH